MSYRSKSGGALITSQKQWARVNGSGNWYFTGSEYATSYDEDTRWQMTGLDIPSYHRRRKRGELLPYTPYTNFRTHAGNSVGRQWYRRTGANDGGGWCEPGVPNPNTITATPAKLVTYGEAALLVQDKVVNLLDQAASAVYSKNTMDALTFALELKKTIQLFTQFPQRLIDLLKPGSRGGLPVTWLEYRYGWRILYYDVLSFLNASNRIGDARTRFTERVGYNEVMAPTVVQNDINFYDVLRSTESITTEVTLSRRGTITVDTEGLNPFQSNPIQTAWELIPYSFVIDWVIGIGDWISGMSAQLAFTGYSGSSSVKARILRNYKLEQYYTNPDYTGEMWAAGDSVSEIVVRVPATFKLHPSINIELDNQKLLDLVFLLKGYRNNLSRR